MSKFAPLTSQLLMRKGAAAPSLAYPAPQERPQIALVADATLCRHPEAQDAGKKPRRIVLSLSAQDYEALGLIAVKRETSRHGLAQEAMQRYLASLHDAYGCACTQSCIGACETR